MWTKFIVIGAGALALAGCAVEPGPGYNNQGYSSSYYSGRTYEAQPGYVYTPPGYRYQEQPGYFYRQQ